MPFTRKQNAREKSSLNSDVVSDKGNMDIFLATLTQNDLENEPEIEQEFDSVFSWTTGKY